MTQHTTFPLFSFGLFLSHFFVQFVFYCTCLSYSHLSHVTQPAPVCHSQESIASEIFPSLSLSLPSSKLCECRAVSESAGWPPLVSESATICKARSLPVLQSCAAYLWASPNSPDRLPRTSANARAWQTGAPPSLWPPSLLSRSERGEKSLYLTQIARHLVPHGIMLPLCANG